MSRPDAVNALRHAYGSDAVALVKVERTGRFLDVDCAHHRLAGERLIFASPPEPAESRAAYCARVELSFNSAGGDELAPPMCYDLDGQAFVPLSFRVRGGKVGVSAQGFGQVLAHSASAGLLETLILQGRRERTVALLAARFGPEFAGEASRGNQFLLAVHSANAGTFAAGGYARREDAERALSGGPMLLVDLCAAEPEFVPVRRDNGTVATLPEFAVPLSATDRDIELALS